MDFRITPEHEEIRRVCRRLAGDFATRAAQHDRETSLPLENYATLKQEGLYGLTVPKELGGWGSGFLGYILAAEELAQGCPATALTFNMHCGVLGTLFGSTVDPTVRQRLAALVVEEKKLLAASISESGISSLLLGPTAIPSVQARRVAGGYTLRGRKTFLSMIEGCNCFAVMVHPEEAATPLEAAWFVVPYPSKGLEVEEVWDTLGMRGTRSNDLILKDCFVPKEGFITASNIGTFFERVPHWIENYVGVYLGIGAAAYSVARDTLQKRVPRGFAQPMSYHPDIRRRIAEMSVDLEAARLLLYHAAWMVDTDKMSPAIQAALFRAKYFVGEAVTRITRSALNVCGAHALFKTSPLERLFRDGASASIMPPSSDFCLSAVGMIELGLDPQEMLPPLKVAG